MTYMNMEHPAFDVDMEVLCCIPTFPYSALLSEIRLDTGFTKIIDVREALARLENRYDIQLRRGSDHGWVVSVLRVSAKRATAIGNAYWEVVYGNGR